MKKVKPLGSTSPIVWVVEPSFGCNLRCGHCCAGLIKDEDKGMMSEEAWRATFSILNEVSPNVRVDICGVVGEPTLHPHLTEWLRVARELAPMCQIQITTNGTKLLTKDVTYGGLLDAGANIIYTDQYGPHRRFKELAEESGYPFYRYYDKPDAADRLFDSGSQRDEADRFLPDELSPWVYRGPEKKFIVLQDEPSTWPQSRYSANLLGNWYGNLDWEEGKRFNMRPLLKPIKRRCNQPFQYVVVAASGAYLLCCQDGMHKSEGRFGCVLEGVEGFKRFWYGREMQLVRRRLRLKNRADTDYACAKCNITFSRCDIKHWQDDEVERYWDGSEWRALDAEPDVDRYVREKAPATLF